MSQGNSAFTILSNNTGFADGANIDAFSRQRVSEPVTLFAVQNQYEIESTVLEAGATGTGVAPAHGANDRMVALSCTAGTGTSFVQSYEYIPYQPGKSQLIETTCVVGAAVASAVVDVGLFDAANGLFLRQNGTSGLQVVRRTSTSGSVVDNAVGQSSWNIDKLDGTGASGLTLDITKSQILVIDAQFLAMGRVRIGFSINGLVFYVHQFLNANNLSVPYMQTLGLPVQMLITATTTAGTKSAHFKCAAVHSEGGFFDELGYDFAGPEQTVTAGNGARTHLMSLRPLTTFGGLANRTKFVLESVEICVTGSSPVYWELAVNSAFSAGPTWPGTAGVVGSAFEVTSVATATLSSVGTVIAAGYVSASNQSKGSTSSSARSRYPIALNRAGAVRAAGTLSLFVTGLGGASASRASFRYKEIR